MKYLIGTTQILLGGEFKTRYFDCKCIEAESIEEGIEKYILLYPNSELTARCVGVIDEEDRLIIPDYTSKYISGTTLIPTSHGIFYHLVSKFLDEPPMLTAYCLYLPMFVRAASKDSAIAAYDSNVETQKFPTYYIGYLDEYGTFIVPDIFRFIA